MRRAFAVLTALSLCLPTIAEAQRDRNREQSGAPQAGPQAIGPQGQASPQANESPAAPPQMQQQMARPERGEQRGPGGFLGRIGPNQEADQAANQVAPAPNPGNRRGPNFAQDREQNFGQNREQNFDQNRFGQNREGEFNRGRDFRGNRGDRDRFFNFRGRQFAAVQAPPFRYPRGWGYRHWSRGQILPSFFLTAPYFFNASFLGLPAPPLGTQWVRFGPDALLVDVRTGNIVDVIYDAFWT